MSLKKILFVLLVYQVIVACRTEKNINELRKEIHSILYGINKINDKLKTGKNNPKLGSIMDAKKINEKRNADYLKPKTSCNQFRWGPDCEKHCYCNRYTTCDVTTGVCPRGCVDGYIGPQCDLACRDGTYGPECSKKCNCFKGAKCHFMFGYCATGCKDGYTGLRCEECLKGRWGKNCAGHCSPKCLGDVCHPKHGGCVNGCKPGKKCNTEGGTRIHMASVGRRLQATGVLLLALLAMVVVEVALVDVLEVAVKLARHGLTVLY